MRTAVGCDTLTLLRIRKPLPLRPPVDLTSLSSVTVEVEQNIARLCSSCILRRPIDDCLGQPTCLAPILAASPVPSSPTDPQMGLRLAGP